MKKEDNTQWKTEQARQERRERLERQRTKDGGKRPIKKRVSPVALGGLALALVLGLAIGAITLINGGYFEKTTTAAIVNGEDVKAAKANFYIGSMSSMMIPSGIFTEGAKDKLLQDFSYDGTYQTMRGYFLSGFQKQIQDVMGLAKMARDEGMETTAEDTGKIDGMLRQLQNTAAQLQVTFQDQLTRQYGRGANEKDIRAYVEEMLLASRYQIQKMESMTYTQEEFEGRYDEFKDDLDHVSFRSYVINAATPALNLQGEEEKEASKDETESEESDEERQLRLMEEAKEKAEALIAKVKSEEDYVEAVLEIAGEEERKSLEENDGTLTKGTPRQNLSPEMALWLFDAERKEGDTTVVQGVGGLTTLYFKERFRPTERSYDSRHILIKLDDPSEAAKEAAKAQIEKIYEEYQAGEQTAEAFGKLAEQYSQDEGSKAKGGQYSKVAPGSFVPVYEEFCLADGRKAGDTGIVFADASNYQGYHLIYFEGLNEEAWIETLQNKVRDADFATWLDEQRVNFSYEEVEKGMKYVVPVDWKKLAEIEAGFEERRAEEAEATEESKADD